MFKVSLLDSKRVFAVAFFVSALVLPACQDSAPQQEPPRKVDTAAVDSNPDLFLKIKGDFDRIIAEASEHYHPLVYHFDEDLLNKMDREEKKLQGGTVEAARLIPEIEAKEEDDHFRETIRRWAEKSGKDFRASLDGLAKARAQVDPKKPFHPEFHKEFAEVFDDFIAIEVAEMRERRNRVIHDRLRETLDPHRARYPKIAEHFESLVAVPPYQLPEAATAKAER
ncbi:hypothetical protein [Singulisphaera sp. PoT]|uniref:hypothetical protein n=1 Tax=Singulisphaera sp. PoT TaxID=3411797 RepID=UPI003BF4CC58